MVDGEVVLELFRWGFAQVPAAIYSYADELGLDAEDLGIMGAVFVALGTRTNPMAATGISLGQVLQCYPALGRAKLIRRLSKWESLGLIYFEQDKDWQTRSFYLDPLMKRLFAILCRDHPELQAAMVEAEAEKEAMQKRISEYEEKIRQLEEQLAEQEQAVARLAGDEFRQVAEFLSKKTGNLLSARMTREMRKWIEEMGFEKEFLLAMLEMCIERDISNPREITAIARGIREAGVTNLEGMEAYFQTRVDHEPSFKRLYGFDPEINDFSAYVGIDMTPEARRKMYYKWRYDWQFSPEMIIKAGEIMCQRTKNGGLEYIDAVLADWKNKNIRTCEEAEDEIKAFKRNKERRLPPNKTVDNRRRSEEREIYVPPTVLEKLKSRG